MLSRRKSGRNQGVVALLSYRFIWIILHMSESSTESTRHAELLDLAHDAILIRDLGGRIHYWNRGAELLYGWPKDLAIGRTTQELLQTRYPIPFEEIREVL